MEMEIDDENDYGDTGYVDDINLNINIHGDTVDSEDSASFNDSNVIHQSEIGNTESDKIGPILPGGHRFDRKFVCIRYPANVLDPEKAIDTLGGLISISTAVNTPNRRLELRFRPRDGFCKPACGDRHEVSGFLLRIYVKKSRIEKVSKLSGAKQPPDYRDLISAMPKSNQAVDNSINDLVNEADECGVGSGISEIDMNNRSNILNSTSDDDQNKNPNIDSMSYGKLSFKTSSLFGRQCNKNLAPTFDRYKYDSLSNDVDYILPKLKVMGRISTEFRFTSLCDFQFLPVTRNMSNQKTNECLYDLIYPTEIPSLHWLNNKVPYFLPPAVFSRMDSVQQFSVKTEAKNTGLEICAGKTRKRRAGFSNFTQFNSPTIPMQPPKGIETAMMVKFLNNSHLQLIRSIFDERPIWSKNALIYKTRFTNEQLKILLPSVAYYFITGPWRIMWIRLGYDPRKDPSSRIYQTLDYRLKSMHGLEQSVRGKRTYTNYILPYKSASVSKPKTAVLTNMKDVQHTEIAKNSNDNVYIYREGIIPPSRQMFYQYCDVHASEIQEMLAKLPNPLPGTKCHEKRGWLPSGFSDQCREIINRQVRAVLRKQMNIPEDHPTSLPRKQPTIRDLRRTQTRRNARLKKKKAQKQELDKISVSAANESDEDWEDT